MLSAEKDHELLNSIRKASYALWESESVSLMWSKWCHPTYSGSWDNDLVHIAGINGGDIGVLETHLMVMFEGVFCHCPQWTGLSVSCTLTTGPSLFKDVTWHRLVVGYQNFRTTTWLHHPGVSMKSLQVLRYSLYCWIHSRCSKWLPLVTLWLLSPFYPVVQQVPS
jgi:hypothetical protein